MTAQELRFAKVMNSQEQPELGELSPMNDDEEEYQEDCREVLELEKRSWLVTM